MRAAPYRGGQPRARKRKASIGKNRISAVIYLPTPLVGSTWCLVPQNFPPLGHRALNQLGALPRAPCERAQQVFQAFLATNFTRTTFGLRKQAVRSLSFQRYLYEANNNVSGGYGAAIFSGAAYRVT